jgi:hypothetical protein
MNGAFEATFLTVSEYYTQKCRKCIGIPHFCWHCCAGLQYNVYGLKVSVGFEVLSAVAMKLAVSLEVTPYSSAKVRFYRTSL